MSASRLTLGPVLFNWKPDIWRDFYFRIADEAPLDAVCIGEVVCSKREPFLAPHIPEVIERLQAAGKEIVLSSLALVMSKRESKLTREITADTDFLIEANDVSALSLLAGTPHSVGPFLNVYNEGTCAYLARQGAVRVTLPVEMSLGAISDLISGMDNVPEIEVFAYGRLPLAISARCYHARAHGLTKDGCQYVCDRDPDGMKIDTLDDQAFLSVNGVQTLSWNCVNLLSVLPELSAAGVGRFRLSPQSWDMVAVTRTFREALDGNLDVGEAIEDLKELSPGVEFSNGYLYGQEGINYYAGNAPD